MQLNLFEDPIQELASVHIKPVKSRTIPSENCPHRAREIQQAKQLARFELTELSQRERVAPSFDEVQAHADRHLRLGDVVKTRILARLSELEAQSQKASLGYLVRILANLILRGKTAEGTNLLNKLRTGTACDAADGIWLINTFPNLTAPNRKRLATEISSLLGLEALQLEPLEWCPDDQNRHPTLAGAFYPAPVNPRAEMDPELLKVDLRGVPEHRLNYDRELLRKGAGTFGVADPQQIAHASFTALLNDLRDDCAQGLQTLRTRGLHKGESSFALTLLMSHGLNQAVALNTRVAGTGSAITIRGIKARAGYKVTNGSLQDELLETYLTGRNLVSSDKPSASRTIFSAQNHSALNSEQTLQLKRFSEHRGLPKRLHVLPSQLRPARALLWYLEGESLETVKSRLHHDKYSMTAGYVDGIAFRCAVDKKAVTALDHINALFQERAPEISKIIGIRLQNPIRLHCGAEIRQLLDQPHPKFELHPPCSDVRREKQPMPLAPADLVLQLMGACVTAVEANGQEILKAAAQGPCLKPADAHVQQFVWCSDILLLLSGIKRSELNFARQKTCAQANGAWRIEMEKGCWKPILPAAAFALRWFQAARGGLPKDIQSVFNTTRRKNEQIWFTNTVVASHMASLGLPAYWPVTDTNGGRKQTFTGSKIEKGLVSLFTIFEATQIEVLEYLLGDPRLRRAETVQAELIRCKNADFARSPTARAVENLSLAFGAEIEKRRVGKAPPLPANDMIRNPARLGGGIHVADQLMRRLEVLKQIEQTGERPECFPIVSTAAILRWNAPEFGIRPLGNSKKYTSGHTTLGSTIRAIQDVQLALQGKALSPWNGSLSDWSPDFVLPVAPPLHSANADREVLEVRNNLLACESFQAAWDLKGWSDRNRSAKNTNLYQFIGFSEGQAETALGRSRTHLGFALLHNLNASLVMRWRQHLVERCRPSTTNKKLGHLRQALQVVVEYLNNPQPAEDLLQSIRTQLLLESNEAAKDAIGKIKEACEGIVSLLQSSSIKDLRRTPKRDVGIEPFSAAFIASSKSLSPERDALLISMQVETGLRTAELSRIAIPALGISTSGCGISVVQKGGTVRTVPISAKLASEIQRYVDGERRNVTEKNPDAVLELFVTRDGKRMSAAAVSEAIRASLNRAGYPHIRPHNTRKALFSAFATEFAAGPSAEMAELQLAIAAGHTKSSTTYRYYVAASVRKPASHKWPKFIMNDNELRGMPEVA